MLKYTFFVVSLLLSPRNVFSQWDFAVTTKEKILFFDEHWSEVTSAAHEFDYLSAITFDEVEEKLFFNDRLHNDGNIFSLKLPLVKGNPHIIETVLARTFNESVQAIAYDPLDRTLFWTDDVNQKIFSFPIDETGDYKPKVLFDFANEDAAPDGIAVDLCRRKLYWTNSNQRAPSIHRASMNGADQETLISTDLYFPHGITVDQFSDRIFYVVKQQGVDFTVESAKLDGTDRQIIVKGVFNQPMSLTVTKDSIFWTDRMHNAVWMVSKNNSTGSDPIKMKSLDGHVSGIVSRLGIISKLKSDPHCRDVIVKIEEGLALINNRTDNPSKKDDSNNMICLGNGKYNDINKACSCKAGYFGARCETFECHNFCVHGSCAIVDGETKCTCHLGFAGERCQTYKCSNYCMNGASCEIQDDEPQCDCPADLRGIRCETNVTKTCLPYCTRLHKNMGIKLPFDCYGVCQNQNPTNEEIQPVLRPEAVCSRNKSVMVVTIGLVSGLAIVYLIIVAVQHIYKPARPRIKKTFSFNPRNSHTPLTSRPMATDQCEITIENCCNMNICDTPCFDPKLLQQNMVKESKSRSKKDDKQILINNADNGDLF